MIVSVDIKGDNDDFQRFRAAKKQSQIKPILVPYKLISSLTAQLRNFFVVLVAGSAIL